MKIQEFVRCSVFWLRRVTSSGLTTSRNVENIHLKYICFVFQCTLLISSSWSWHYSKVSFEKCTTFAFGIHTFRPWYRDHSLLDFNKCVLKEHGPIKMCMSDFSTTVRLFSSYDCYNWWVSCLTVWRITRTCFSAFPACTSIDFQHFFDAE